MFHIFLIIISFGLILIPDELSDCDRKNGEIKSCCENKRSNISEHEKPASKAYNQKLSNPKPVSDKSHHDCDGHCNHNSCSCASLSFSVNLPQTIDLKLVTPNLDSENTIISHNENRLPSGFHSIWLPPVIS